MKYLWKRETLFFFPTLIFLHLYQCGSTTFLNSIITLFVKHLRFLWKIRFKLSIYRNWSFLFLSPICCLNFLLSRRLCHGFISTRGRHSSAANWSHSYTEMRNENVLPTPHWRLPPQTIGLFCTPLSAFEANATKTQTSSTPAVVTQIVRFDHLKFRVPIKHVPHGDSEMNVSSRFQWFFPGFLVSHICDTSAGITFFLQEFLLGWVPFHSAQVLLP